MNHHHDHSDFADIIATFKVEKKPKSLVAITGEIPLTELAKHEDHVLQHLGKDIEIKGFRKGHVPADMLRKQIGEMALFAEVAEHTLSHMYPAIIEHFKLDALGRPEIHAEKMAPGNPFGFRIETAVLPEVSLSDYKKVAHGINALKEESSVSEKDIAEAIEKIQRQKLSYDRLQAQARKKAASDAAQKEGLTLPTPDTATSEIEEDITKAPLPELTDEYVKTLGAFDSVEAFKTQVTTHLTEEKKNEVTGKHRAALTDALIEGSTIDLPQVLIQSELGQMFGQMEDDLKRAGLTLAGYLEHIQKKEEDLIADWTPAAEKRAKTQLILNEIAKKENLTPNQDAVQREMAQVLEQYKDADASRVQVYVESVLRNAEVMEFLEKQ